MSTLSEILSPSFVLRDALVASVLVGLVCPLVGVYFVLRRMIFLGVALPQVSAAGIAFSFLAYKIAVGPHETLEVSERFLAVVGSFVFTLATTLVLAMLERRGRETVEARIGTTYAVAAAATILFLAKDPHGDAQMVNMLKGDILATTGASLTWMAEILGLVVVALFAFRKELLLVSFDRDLAVVFGKRAALWDIVLYLLIGTVISLGVMTAGPMATFGFLIVPPVTMRLIARRMVTFSLGSAAMGAATAFAGFYCAYRYDLPLGPAEVGLASIVLGVVAAVTGVRNMAARWRSA
jgi:ABC-type Mn2+/Zn2+ transport system permease subunit